MNQSIDEEIAELLMNRGYSIATAESCTGGLLAARLIDRPGSSAYFPEGAVTYSNEAKTARLGVRPKTLEVFGAVSAETAEEMAAGIAARAGTDVGLSTTGIAGPDGGTTEKPVGLVHIGISVRGKTSSRRFVFSGSRRDVREQAVERALRMLAEALR